MSSPSGKRITLQDSPRVKSISQARRAALRPGPSPSNSSSTCEVKPEIRFTCSGVKAVPSTPTALVYPN